MTGKMIGFRSRNNHSNQPCRNYKLRHHRHSKCQIVKSSRKQIIRDTERLRINLPRKINWWGEIWTWRKPWLKSRSWCVVLGAFLVEENYQGFYLVGQPSEISRNYVLWCLVCRDLSLEDFWKLNFSSFSTEAVETRYFRELLVRNNKYHTCKEFF